MNPDHDSPSTGTIGKSPGGFVPKTLFPPPLWVVDIINTLHAGYFFSMLLLSSAYFFQKITFSKNCFSKTISVKRKLFVKS